MRALASECLTPNLHASAWPRRHTYAAIAAGATVFAVYGSLVPFEFQPIALDRAIEQFRHVRYLTLGVGSRADFVSNILLFVPLGLFTTAALRADRRGWLGGVAAAVAVPAMLALLSIAIEFTQVFFPPRTVSINDIVAETAGGMIGTAMWFAVGQALTEWLRAFFRERERPALLTRLLLAYTALFLLAQLLPFDITVDLGELAQKHREGRILAIPFQYHHDSVVLALWDYVGDVLLHAPVGLLARLAWTTHRRPRPALGALAIGLAVVAGVELAQVVIFSRYADATDVITGGIGVALGIALAGPAAQTRTSAPEAPRAIRLLPSLGVVVWIAVMLSYHWYPFDFQFRSALLDERLPLMFRVPFSSYYYGSEFHAFTEVTRKFLLAVPFGVLLRLAWPAFERATMARLQTTIVVVHAFVFFAAVEVGQIFLLDRTADITDALIASSGCIAGLSLVALMASTRAHEPGVTADDHFTTVPRL